MALDWLKTILGDHYTEDIDKKVSEEIGKGFVARADFNAKNETAKTLTEQLKEAGKTIESFKAMDIEGVKKSAEDWKQKAEQAEKDATAKIADMQFEAALDGAIMASKGKNAKAVKALLDVDTLKASKDQSADITKALDALKKESGYLFEQEQTPPPYAGGTGTNPVNAKYTPEVNAIRAAAGLKTE